MAMHTVAQTERKLSAVTGDPKLRAALDLGAMGLSASLAQTAAALRNRIEQGPLAAVRLSFTGFQALWVVWAWPAIETREIASELAIGKSALSGVLATLERRGLIVRSKSNEDARLVNVSLTAEGTELIESLLPQVNAVEVVFTSAIHENNREFISDTLAQLRAN
ncbi:MAG: MarR family winged helix-turn-helix transcriptional regulator [Micrococcales bacterium]